MRKAKDLDLDLLSTRTTGLNAYDETYKQSVFWCWYRSGKPAAAKLQGLIEPTVSRTLPSESTLKGWIVEFKEKAEPIDSQVTKYVQEKAISEKVEMLTRHAEIGQGMQDLALDYLEKNKEKINQNSAVRLLIEGIRIERESRGLPTMITKIQDSSDEDLIKQIKDLMEGVGNIEIVESKFVDETEELSDLQ